MSLDADMLQLTNLEAAALARLIAQDSQARRPRVYALVKAIAAGGKLAEQVVRSVFFGMTYEGATGKQRDDWGKLFNLRRGDLDEATIRTIQDMAIYVSTVDATVPRMLALLEIVFPNRTLSAAINLPNGATFYVTGGAAATEAVKAKLGTLFAAYQPATHMFVVGEVAANTFEFDLTGDENEGRPLPELIYGGR